MKWKILSVLSALIGVVAAVPAPARAPCYLGYYAFCPYTPLTTIAFFALAAASWWMGKRRQG